MAPKKEKRRHRRVTVGLPIKLEYNDQIIESRTKNISSLGACLEIAQPMAIGIALAIEIRLPNKPSAKPKVINCSGAVSRCQPKNNSSSEKVYETGVFFRSFFGKGENEISRFIEKILSEEEKAGKLILLKRQNKTKAIKKGGRS